MSRWWANVSWGLASRPDVLLHEAAEQNPWEPSAMQHQQMQTPCVRVKDFEACSTRCSTTLGCVAWTLLPKGRCCLRQWMPHGFWRVDGAVSGTLDESARCRTKCTLARPVQQHFGPPPHRLVRTASADELPWLDVLRGVAPEPARTPRATEPPPRIAVCLAGQVRTLVHPTVWRSLHERLLEHGKHDLFAVLGTGSAKVSAQPPPVRAETGAWEDRAPNACALEVALSALRPVAVEFIMTEGGAPCHKRARRESDEVAFASLQFAKWARCAKLVESHEVEAGISYDWLFKTRPDILWRETLHLSDLAAAMPSPDVVLTSNDLHALVHRSRFGILEGMASIGCDRRCDGSSALLSAFFHSYNEYGLLMMHLAKHRARHLEVSHPYEASLMHYVSGASWTAGLRRSARRPRIARFHLDPGVGVARGARTLCSSADVPTIATALHLPVRCWLTSCMESPSSRCHRPHLLQLPSQPPSRARAMKKSSPRSDTLGDDVELGVALEYLAFLNQRLPRRCNKTRGVSLAAGWGGGGGGRAARGRAGAARAAAYGRGQ
jgi:hypothetical protein